MRGVLEATGVTEALNFALALFIIELPPGYSPMTFAKWLSLSEEEREAEKRSWYPFEPGYWHSLAVEAAARFSAEFGSKRHVTRVFKSLYHARELIVAVQTDVSPGKKVKLPESYLGFKIMQFANQIPEGVLVDPPPRTHEAETASHYILRLEGEIDLHVSPRIATKLHALIKDKPKKLVIDLSKVSYIDSSGLAVLIEGMREVEAYRGKLYLVGMQETVRVIFEMSRLDQVFRIRHNVADALAVS